MLLGTDVLYHCAATPHEGLSVFSPSLIADNVLAASAATFSAAISAGVRRIVFLSSMSRYGTGIPPFREGDWPSPVDPYGICKLAAENLLVNLAETHGIEYVVAVPHNVIGPRQKYDDPYRNVASIMINRVLRGQPIIIYGDGQQKRCFSWIGDAVGCLKKMLDCQPGPEPVFNIGPDEEEVTIHELAYRISQLMEVPFTPLHMPGRPREVRVATCSSDKARAALGYKTTVSLTNALQMMIADMRERGPKPFKYHLPIEIHTHKTPETWTERMF